VGEPDEGMLLLPVSALPRTALRRAVSHPAVIAPAATPRPSTRSRGQRPTTVVGYVNRNQQTVIKPTGLRGTDHGQSIYVLRCEHCGLEYGSNGSDNFQRKCPQCQGGAPGLQYS
jgi:hypothetical protein